MATLIYHYPVAKEFYCDGLVKNPLPLYALGVLGADFNHGNIVPVGATAQWFRTGVGLIVETGSVGLITLIQNPLYKNLSSPSPVLVVENSGEIMVGLWTLGGQTSIIEHGDKIAQVNFVKAA